MRLPPGERDIFKRPAMPEEYLAFTFAFRVHVVCKQIFLIIFLLTNKIYSNLLFQYFPRLISRLHSCSN